MWLSWLLGGIWGHCSEGVVLQELGRFILSDRSRAIQASILGPVSQTELIYASAATCLPQGTSR